MMFCTCPKLVRFLFLELVLAVLAVLVVLAVLAVLVVLLTGVAVAVRAATSAPAAVSSTRSVRGSFADRRCWSSSNLAGDKWRFSAAYGSAVLPSSSTAAVSLLPAETPPRVLQFLVAAVLIPFLISRCVFSRIERSMVCLSREALPTNLTSFCTREWDTGCLLAETVRLSLSFDCRPLCFDCSPFEWDLLH
jgi:hypothetical protein